MKTVLNQFVEWIDNCYGQGVPASPSPFEQMLEPGLLAAAQSAASNAALSSGPIFISTEGVPAATVAANLVWAKTGITPDRVHRGDFSPQELELLIAAVAALVASRVCLDDSLAASNAPPSECPP